MSEPDPRTKRELQEAGRRAVNLLIAKRIERDEKAVAAEFKRLEHDEDNLFVTQVVIVLVRILDDLLNKLSDDVVQAILAGYAGQLAADDLTDLDDLR